MVSRCRKLSQEIEIELELGEKLLEQKRVPKIAIAGPPNVGKSTLMNFITAEDLSITSSIAGTTRDTVRGEIQIQGNKLEILDTAGIRETSEPIEQIGISKALYLKLTKKENFRSLSNPGSMRTFRFNIKKERKRRFLSSS